MPPFFHEICPKRLLAVAINIAWHMEGASATNRTAAHIPSSEAAPNTARRTVGAPTSTQGLLAYLLLGR
jgi:hypothetical protein